MNAKIEKLLGGKTIRQLINEGTFDPDKGQYLNWMYWDRQVLDSTSTNNTFMLFRDGTGGPKSLSDTNYPGGDFPSTEHMEIWNLELWFYNQAPWTSATWQNWIDYLMTTTLQLTISTKSPQLQIPLTRAYGLSLPNLLTTAVAGDQLPVQDPIKAVYPLDIEITLQALTPWHIDLIQSEGSDIALDDMLSFVGIQGPKITM